MLAAELGPGEFEVESVDDIELLSSVVGECCCANELVVV